MKRKVITAWAITLSLLIAFIAQAETLQLDTSKSEIHWVGKKVTGKHNGVIKLKQGVVSVTDGMIEGGDFSIDMATITVEDIQDEKRNQKLTNHLKSDDFFSVEQFPEGKFVITSITEKPDDIVEVTGNLTLKGITHPITFPATLTHSEESVAAKGKITIDRTKWNIRYGSGKFFKGLGDKLIDDDIELKLSLHASK